MKQLSDSLANLEKTIKARQAQRTAHNKTAEIVHLPIWPESTRGVPNSALRGALFAAIQGKDRRALKRELLAVQQGIEIRFTGWQLDQSDMDVWEQALHFARRHPLGNRCQFTAHSFLKALGRKTGKSQHEQLKDNLTRLTGCAVEITHDRMTYCGNLLEFYRDEDTSRYRLEINPKIKALYDAGFTYIDWHQRQALRGKPLALWLHGFLASHAEPYPLKLETLHRLSGSQTKQIKHFKANLIAALGYLQAIGAINGYVIDDNNLITINRTPSSSQRKHLTKAKSGKN